MKQTIKLSLKYHGSKRVRDRQQEAPPQAIWRPPVTWRRVIRTTQAHARSSLTTLGCSLNDPGSRLRSSFSSCSRLWQKRSGISMGPATAQRWHAYHRKEHQTLGALTLGEGGGAKHSPQTEHYPNYEFHKF